MGNNRYQRVLQRYRHHVAVLDSELLLHQHRRYGKQCKQPVLHRLLPHHSLRCRCYGCCKKNVHPHRKRLACRSCKRNDHDLHRLRKHLFERWHGRLVLRSIISLALRAGIRKSTCSFFALSFPATQITLAFAQIHITKRKQTLVSISKTHTDTHRKPLHVPFSLHRKEKTFPQNKKTTEKRAALKAPLLLRCLILYRRKICLQKQLPQWRF